MPAFQKTERLTASLWADSQAVKGWRDKARVQGISALCLVRNPDYAVYAVRNSRSLLGLAAVKEGDSEVYLLHLASRDYGRGTGKLLIEEIMRFAGKRRIRTIAEPEAESFYEHLGWRKVGKEYWSK